MSFDIIQFLEQHHIPYREFGKNVGRGEINIRCPFCGDSDPSEHMGINLATGRWNCLRASGKHSGYKIQRLITRLIGCTMEQANRIVLDGRDLNELQSIINRLKSKQSSAPKVTSLKLPKEFRKLTVRGSGLYYYNYLIRRGFQSQDLPALVEKYDLHFATTGIWHGRIIFPITHKKQLMCWVGRTISKTREPRYLNLEDSKAVHTVKETVLNYDMLIRGGSVLAITEGPFDALKIDAYGHELGLRATCLFGTGISNEQIYLVSELREQYDRIVIIGDEGADKNVVSLLNQLSTLLPKPVKLPSGVSDPGDLTPKQIETVYKQILSS